MKRLTFVACITVFLAVVFVFQAHSSFADSTCKVTGVSWGGNVGSSVTLGQQVPFTVFAGGDCSAAGSITAIITAQSAVIKSISLTGSAGGATEDNPTAGDVAGSYTFQASDFAGQTSNTNVFIQASGAANTAPISSATILVANATPVSTTSGTTSTTSSSSQKYTFNITNPLCDPNSAGSCPQNAVDIINIVAGWLFNISIPIAVLAILWAGFLFLTAGPYPANVKKARTILWYTVIGLAIIFIGRGFITLIYSIINLGGTPAATTTTTTTTPTVTGLGVACSSPGASGCSSGLVCDLNSICTRPGGNNYSEPCNNSADCSEGTCNSVSGVSLPVINGRMEGECQSTTSGSTGSGSTGGSTGTAGIGDVCSSSASCAVSTSGSVTCGTNNICQYVGGNGAALPCVTDANCQTGFMCNLTDPIESGNNPPEGFCQASN